MRKRASRTSVGGGKKLHFPQYSAQGPLPLRLGSPPLNMATQTEEVEVEDPSRPGFVSDIMSAIAACQSTLINKIEAVQMDVGLIRQDMDKLRNRMTEAEHRVSQAEDTIAEHSADLRTLKTKIKTMEYKIDDAENRNRRNNLRIVGLAEGAEGTAPTEFVETLLKQLLPQANFSQYYAVERAHRVPPRPGPPGSPPRTFIFRFLNFRDRDEVLRAARVQGEIRYRNAKLLIFPDYSIETQKLRRSFDAVKALLRAKNLKYSILFPARLRVQDGETVRFFMSPREASAWLETLPAHR